MATSLLTKLARWYSDAITTRRYGIEVRCDCGSWMKIEGPDEARVNELADDFTTRHKDH